MAGKKNHKPREIDYTPEEIAFIKENYGKLTHAQIAEKLGRTRGAITTKMHHLGLNYKCRTKKRNLNIEEWEWLRRNFSDLRNEICATRLGVSRSTLIKMARSMGLNKSAQFIKESRSFSGKRTAERHPDYNNLIPFVSKKAPKN